MIDVIIPVYRGTQQTRACIDSVLGTQGRIAKEIVVIDDASPEPAISSYLRNLAAQGSITLLENPVNAGFVKSVNRGMGLHEDRDVVILNSDTEVANDWLDRLHAAAHAHPNVGTATPFSNNATICSYPFEGWTGGLPGTLGLAALDAIFARVNARLSIDLPTAVGFCMFIRRNCLHSVGMFDAERFGRGYGEENDFCMRASKGGWRNILAADVFVYHEGSVSFSADRFDLMKSATATLHGLHPEYPLLVDTFIEADAAKPLRTAIDCARAQTGPEEARCVIEERAREGAMHLREIHQRRKAAREYEKHDREVRDYLGQLNASIAERDAALAHERGLLSENEAETLRLRTGLENAESLAFARAKELEEKEAASARLIEALRHAESLAFARAEELAERDAEASRLAAGLHHAESLAFARAKELEDKEAELKGKEAELKDKEAELEDKKAQLEDKKAELARLADTLRQAELLAFSQAKEIDEIRALPGWRYYDALLRRRMAKAQ